MALQKMRTPGSSHLHESILVVKRTDFFNNDPAWHGIKTENVEPYLEIIKTKKYFLPRATMEIDPTYKQVIPYLIFHHANTYFLMQRQAKASEARLQNKFTLGIGGHVRQEDMSNDSLFAWAQREFNEEVNYKGNFDIQTIGILNDDSNEVGKVHVGLVLLLNGDVPEITVRSELKNGKLVSLDECMMHYDQLESWSQMVVEHLKNKK